MPVEKCQIDNQDGYRWGPEGKCYTGADAEAKAAEQGRAIQAAGGEYELESYNDYPEAAKNNAKRALAWVEANGWGTCGEATGKQRANQLANGENLSRDTIARMSSFQRHQQYKDVPYSAGCGGLMWDAWGGTAGIEWAQRKLKEIDSIEQALSIVKLANDRIGFDYDDTLTTNNIQNIVNRLITAGGTIVYIVSARQSEMGMYSLANKLGIPNHRIYATGSNKAKVAKVKELGLTKFYDNNPDVIKELPGVGILVR